MSYLPLLDMVVTSYGLLYYTDDVNIICVGESGLVYRGYIKTAVGKEIVAIKTGKGNLL